MANDLLLKAESAALIGKIYFKFMPEESETRLEKAHKYYRDFLKDAGVLIGTDKNPDAQGWYIEAKDFDIELQKEM